MLKNFVVVIVLSLAMAVGQESEGFVQEGVHEHGAASLNIAQEQADLFIEFISPAINIVGFEYQAKSEEEKMLVAQALEDLSEGAALFSPNAEAQCSLITADIDSELAEDEHEHEDEHEEGEHKDEHEEGEHKEEDEHEHEHEEGEHEDEHEHEEGEVHSEFHASYTFSCENAERLTAFDLSNLFALYPDLLVVDVQYALELGQGATELTMESTNLSF